MPMEAQFDDTAARMAAQTSLNEPVLAASRCRRFGATDRIASQLGGLQGANMRLNNKMNLASRSFNQHLPEHFLIAVTATGVHALDVSDRRGEVKVGKEYVRWDRATLQPTLAPAQMPGTPADGQVVVVKPPPDLRHAGRTMRKLATDRGVPVQLLFGKDAASQQVVDLLVADGIAQGARQPMVFGPATQFGGGGAPAAAAPAGLGALEQLADLHARGVLTDEEFAQQKAAILSRGLSS